MVQILSIAASAVLFFLVIDFIRRGLLKEKYSVLWLIATVAVAILSIWRGILDYVAILVGVSYPPSLLFLTAFIFVLLILLHFSVVISILTDRTKHLTQELAILRAEGPDGAGGPAPEKKKAGEEVS